VDGVSIPDLQRYRVQTPLHSIVLPPGNFANYPVPEGKDQRWVSVEDGYFIFLPPLPVGKHVIMLTFTDPDTGKPVVAYTFNPLIQNPNEPLP
jgi:hypothetical protein